MTFPGVGGQPGSIGSAFIDFHINPRNVVPETKDAMDKVAKDSDKISEKAGKALGESLGEQMADEIEKPGWFQRIGNALGRTFRRNRNRTPPITVDVDVDTNQVSGVGRKIGNTIRQGLRSSTRGIGNMIEDVIGGVGGGISGGLRSLGSSFGNVGSNGPFALIVGAALPALIMALVGAVAALLAVFAPLLNILLLLPAAFISLFAVIAPVILAFQGLGEAIGALASGDPKQIAEALKGFGASARQVLMDIQPLIPWFKDFKRFTQEAFFGPLVGMLPRLQRALGPEFITGFQRVARAAGEFAANLILVAENPVVSKFFDMLFSTGANIFSLMEGPFGRLFLALSELGIVSLPYIEKGVATIGGWIDKLSGWLTEISNNGDFQSFMDKLEKALDNLGILAESGWNLIVAIIGGANEQDRAQGFFDNLIGTIDSLTLFFESETGQAAIQGMITLAEIFLFLLLGILGTFGLIAAAVEAVRVFLVQVVKWAETLYHWVERILFKISGIKRSTNSFAGSVLTAAGFAEGGIVTSPTLATLGEDYRREVVIPLEDPARARQLAQASGLTNMLGGGGSSSSIIFGAGAIQVNFMGAAPTEEEAHRTGAAVGRGIQDQLARRNTRLAVRTR